MKKEPLIPGNVYHFLQPGKQPGEYFPEERNYPFFIGLMKFYILPIAHIYAYSLIKIIFIF